MKHLWFPWSVLTTILLTPAVLLADEGQWQPHMLKDLQGQLDSRGIRIPAAQLADLSQYPMNAMVSLGYCSASFVSKEALVITNHHCAYGAIQQNSTKEHNLIAKGFLAKAKAEELPAGPQERLYITEQMLDVTAQVTGVLAADLSPAARYAAIENQRKMLIKDCETDANYRCSVVSFHHGLQYFLLKQLMIQDVRLVYAPPESVGNFGGDIDNYEYPRHTGDFAFLRGYVGKDGKPAAYSVDNVPYQPKSFLKVNVNGVRAGDGILLAGYPGKTSRYRLALAPYTAIPGSPRWYADATKIRLYMGAGLPVITTHVPPLGKQIEKAQAGIVVKDSSTEFSNAITRLFQRPSEYKELRNNTISFAKDNTWNNTYDKAMSQMDRFSV